MTQEQKLGLLDHGNGKKIIIDPVHQRKTKIPIGTIVRFSRVDN
jgi:hypothetical protein